MPNKFTSVHGPDGPVLLVPDAIIAVEPTNVKDPSSPTGTRTLSLVGGHTLVMYDTDENLKAIGIGKGI